MAIKGQTLEQFHGYTQSVPSGLQGPGGVSEYSTRRFTRQVPSNFRSFTAPVIANESNVILAYNENRSYMMLQNVGTVPLFIAFDTIANDTTIAIPVGSSFIADYAVPVNDVNIFASASGVVAVAEGVFFS